jgi:hypothetical protein
MIRDNVSNQTDHNYYVDTTATEPKDGPTSVTEHEDGPTSVFELFPVVDGIEEPNEKVLSCPYNLSFFVYEGLPTNMTVALEYEIQAMARRDGRVQENMATEYALLQLFRTSPCRVYNSSQAHYFFVPYMHHSHCILTPGYSLSCGQVPDADLDALFATLHPLYTPASRQRHIFVNAYDDFMSKPQMKGRNTFLRLTSGPLNEKKDEPGGIVLPIFHDGPDFQPSMLRKKEESWWTRPRKYAFAAFFDARLSPRMKKKSQPRRFRAYFVDSLRDYPETVAGYPYLVMSIGTTTNANGTTSVEEQSVLPPATIDYVAAYRESVLCPILPGDNCWQRRFFDVIRNGCLPLVLEWPKDNGERSWHTPGQYGCSTQLAYPFIKGMFWNDPRIEIDYDSFVVRALGNVADETNVSSILTTMEEILADPQEVARRQRNMMAVAPLLTFGLGQDAHVYDDAFARIMRILEYRASRMSLLQ